MKTPAIFTMFVRSLSRIAALVSLGSALVRIASLDSQALQNAYKRLSEVDHKTLIVVLKHFIVKDASILRYQSHNLDTWIMSPSSAKHILRRQHLAT